MEHKQRHYTGLTDAEVVASRRRHGANVLTPPKEDTVWQRLKNCLHFWLVRLLIVLFLAAVAAVAVLPLCGVVLPSDVFVGPLILVVLLVFTFFVAYLGGSWDAEACRFDMDALITILLAALVLAGVIAFYQGVFGGIAGFEPYFEPTGIAVAILLATGVAHILEASNEKTFKRLNEVNDDTMVKVVRNNNVSQVMRRDIVVDDVVLLSAGEEVPADCELLDAMGLLLNESSLTGETSCRKTLVEADFDTEATYPSNHLMKGTTILEGYCTARVFAVGDATACGMVFEAAQVRDGDPTPLSRNLDGLAALITKASYIIAALILVCRIVVYFVLGVGDAGSVDFVKYVLESVMIAVTLIVVAVPEGLPMAVTLSLAFSMKRLMKQHTMPRTMHACETMGAASVICTDKTGTLTQNQMRVREWHFPTLPSRHFDGGEAAACIAEAVAANSTADLDFSDAAKVKAVGNPTEGALLLWLHEAGVDYREVREAVPLLDRIPFSTENKYMVSVVRSRVRNCRVLYVTGAPDILLNMCHLAPGERDAYDTTLAAYQRQAMRTLALAYSVLDDDDNVIFDRRLHDSVTLTMMGVVAIADPVRPDVSAAIGECLAAGIKVKVVTGDTVGTAREIARQVGLWFDDDTDSNILQGSDVQSLSDAELRQRLPQVKIIARARPNDKERVVRALKDLGEVVAVTGDGTNDAPALNAAHVGLSMGDGTAVAKEASDMTILDNSFATIANAVMWGRSLYKNIKRFILFQMTVNVTACLIVLVGAFLGTDSPLTVTQMLWVNLIMDTFAALALASLPPSQSVMLERPRPITEPILKDIGRPILAVGLTFFVICLAFLLLFQHSDIIALTTLSYGWGAPNGLSPHEQGLFFTLFVMLHFWYMFNAKAFMTNDSAFKGLSWRHTRWFIVITALIFVVQILLVEMPGLQQMFNVAAGGLGIANWGVIIAGTSLVLWIGELCHLVRRHRLEH